jgi:hypothetical protein
VYIRKGTVVLESPLILKHMLRITSTVLKLSEPLLHKGYTLWFDNYYTSLDVVTFLKHITAIVVVPWK